MKKLLCMLVLAGVLALPALSDAEAAGMYITPKFIDSLQNTGNVGGDDGLSSKTLNSVGGGVAVGLHMRDYTDGGVPLRFEFEYASRSKINDSWGKGLNRGRYLKAAWQVQTFQINGYWDIDTGCDFTPYIGAGLGVSSIYESMTSGDGKYRHSSEDINMGFAWNVGAGVAYSFTENVALDVGYRFAGFGYSHLKHQGSNVENYMTANEFMAGVRFSF